MQAVQHYYPMLSSSSTFAKVLVLGPRCSYSSRDAGTASADVSSGASAAVDAADVSSASVLFLLMLLMLLLL